MIHSKLQDSWTLSSGEDASMFLSYMDMTAALVTDDVNWTIVQVKFVSPFQLMSYNWASRFKDEYFWKLWTDADPIIDLVSIGSGGLNVSNVDTTNTFK